MFTLKAHLYNQFVNIYALEEYSGQEYITKLCEKAITNKVASITILPKHINQAWEILKGSQVKISCAINFPHGDESLQDIETETRMLYESGVDEIELVIPYKNFIHQNNLNEIINCVNLVKDIILERKALRINIEAPLLGSSLYIHQVCQAILSLGINFIKNATPLSANTSLLQINAILEKIEISKIDCGLDVHIDEHSFALIPDIINLQKIIMPKIKNFTKRNLRFSLSLENFEKLSDLKS